jgi:two-component sensor histidine kinase/PAS domain-containing protein
MHTPTHPSDMPELPQYLAQLRQHLTTLAEQVSACASVPQPSFNDIVDGLTAALDVLEAVQAAVRPRPAEPTPVPLAQAALDALAAQIAILDPQGTIIAVNQAWERFGRAHDTPSFVRTGLGLNYLEVCRRAAAEVSEAQDVLTGLEAVLQGRQASLTLEYPCHAPGQPRWFLLQATPLPSPHQGLVLAHIEITARKQAEDQLRAAVQEKEVLLREVAHRVKNNLQVVSSLLSLQAEASEDSQLEAMFEEIQHRIQSMALVHELLQQADNLARINLAHYAARLTEEMARAYAVDLTRITLETELDDVWVSLETATPCGLLLHELLSNCFKHAFPEGRTGRVRVALQATAEQSLMLRVGDTGCGFPDTLDFRATDSLGLQLVCTLTEQLQGTIALEREAGTHVTITVPL